MGNAGNVRSNHLRPLMNQGEDMVKRKAPSEDRGFRYVDGAWRASKELGAVQLSELKLLTLNVLFELFGDVETHWEASSELERWPF